MVARLKQGIGPYIEQAQQQFYTRFQPWYTRLSHREQRLCIIAAILLPLMLLILGVWRPLHHQVTSIEHALPILEAEWQEAQKLADRLQRSSSHSATTGTLSSLIEKVSRRVETRKFLTRIKPQPTMGDSERLMLQFSAVPFDKLVRFLGELADAGIGIHRAKIQKSAQAGVVNVTILVVRE